MEYLIFSLIFFLYGVVIGSFLNVVILRVPLKESISTKRSHCMECGHTLAWYDLFPLFSYLFLGGKCRYCKTKISCQYPIVEGLNGLLYVGLYLACGRDGDWLTTVLYCGCASALLSLSVIDWRTKEIPFGINIFIFVLGLARLFTDLNHFSQYLIGLFAVSGFLFLLYIFSGGRAMGGGDIKLMAATGLLIGWQLNILAFLMGCILASIIHSILMAMKKADRVLAFGPYLSMGVYLAMIWGRQLVGWYLSMWSFM